MSKIFHPLMTANIQIKFKGFTAALSFSDIIYKAHSFQSHLQFSSDYHLLTAFAWSFHLKIRKKNIKLLTPTPFLWEMLNRCYQQVAWHAPCSPMQTLFLFILTVFFRNEPSLKPHSYPRKSRRVWIIHFVAVVSNYLHYFFPKNFFSSFSGVISRDTDYCIISATSVQVLYCP